MQETTPTSWYQECDFFHAFGWDLRGEGGTWKLDAEDITVVKEDYRLGASNDPEYLYQGIFEAYDLALHDAVFQRGLDLIRSLSTANQLPAQYPDIQAI
eukprot:1247019-Rhodomonas_salina.1